MRNLLALIGLLVVGVVVIGWYCGWYTLTVTKGTDGNAEIKTTVNTEKVGADTSSFFDRVGKLVREQAAKDGKAGQPDSAPGNTPGPGTSGKNSSPRGGWFVSTPITGKEK